MRKFFDKAYRDLEIAKVDWRNKTKCPPLPITASASATRSPEMFRDRAAWPRDVTNWTYDRIADHFNDYGHRTPWRRRQWNFGSVRYLVMVRKWAEG